MSKIRRFRYIFIALVIVVVLAAFFAFGKRVKQKWIVYETIQSPHWQERFKEMEGIKPGRYKTIFLGNSLTELFDLDHYFADSCILNCGIVGDFTEGLLKRAGTIVKLQPEKLFIEIGINDMIEKISLDEICGNYEELIKLVKKGSPSTKIYIQSNLPVIINRPSLFTNDEDVNNLIVKQNENLKKLASETGCVYIDVYTAMSKEKNRESLFIWDGIHFTPKGYEIWKNVLLPYLGPSKSDK